MQDLEELALTLTAGAVVSICDANGDCMVRPAAFVFETPTGFGWVEPSYADPFGSSSNAFHIRDGTVVVNADEAVITTENGQALTISAYEPGGVDLIGDALDWFAEYVVQNGLVWAEERNRVRAIVFPS